MENMLVFFDNKMNTLDFRGLKSSEMDLFMTVLSRVPHDRDSYKDFEYIKISFEEFKEVLSSRFKLNRNELKRQMDIISEKLSRINISWQTLNKSGTFNIFPASVWDVDEQYMYITVAEDFKDIVNVLFYKGGFTMLELQKYIKLRSKSAKGLYMLLAQFKRTGVIYNIHPLELKRILRVSDSERMNNVIDRNLMPALRLLKDEGCIADFQKPDIKYSNRKGNPIMSVSLKYTFAGEHAVSTQEVMETKDIEAVRDNIIDEGPIWTDDAFDFPLYMIEEEYNRQEEYSMDD